MSANCRSVQTGSEEFISETPNNQVQPRPCRAKRGKDVGWNASLGRRNMPEEFCRYPSPCSSYIYVAGLNAEALVLLRAVVETKREPTLEGDFEETRIDYGVRSNRRSQQSVICRSGPTVLLIPLR